MEWKKGRGKLGLLKPLLGTWIANAEENTHDDADRVRVARSFAPTLDGKYISMDVRWHLKDKVYEDHTLIGVNPEKEICSWTFTSDGKQSTGQLTDVSDIHPQAIGFESEMPHGTARQAYWPAADGGFHWMAQALTKKGWEKMVAHHYQPQRP